MDVNVIGVDLLVNSPEPVDEVFLSGGEGSVILNFLRVNLF